MRITSLIILPNQREYIQSIFPLKYGRKQNYFAKRFNSYTLKGGRPGLKSILLVYRKCYFHFYNFYVLFTMCCYVQVKSFQQQTFIRELTYSHLPMGDVELNFAIINFFSFNKYILCSHQVIGTRLCEAVTGSHRKVQNLRSSQSQTDWDKFINVKAQSKTNKKNAETFV